MAQGLVVCSVCSMGPTNYVEFGMFIARVYGLKNSEKSWALETLQRDYVDVLALESLRFTAQGFNGSEVNHLAL